jgi:hypothetical protein
MGQQEAFGICRTWSEKEEAMYAEATLHELDGLFTTTARTMEPTGVTRSRKPSGEGDQRVNEDND